MAVLQSTNVQGTLCVNGVVIGGGKDYNYCCFTASTTFTPTSDLVSGDGFVSAHIVGGGGGGGGAYTVAKAGRSPSGPPCAAALDKSGGGGAGGGYYVTQSFITSTDAITVTVGASGSGGGPQDGILMETNCVAACYSASAVIPANFSSTTDGGNSVFNGVTAYGGCGGSSCFVVCKVCGQNTSYCVCQVAGSVGESTVTNAGLYGAFRYDAYNKVAMLSKCATNCGECQRINYYCTTLFDPITASQDVHIPTQFDYQGFSGIGMVGVSSCRPCGVFQNCGVTANCKVTVGTDSASDGVLNPLAGCGNGGAAGVAYAYSNNCAPYDDTFQDLQTGSGANGSGGIVVIQWYE